MTVEELTEVFLRVRQHLTREDARLWAQRFHSMLQERPHRWKIAVEDVAIAYLDDQDHYPKLSEAEALEKAAETRRLLHRQRRQRKNKQHQFEERCIPVDFTTLGWEESNRED